MIINLLKKFQKANVDPLGFGLDFRAHYFGTIKEEWKAWQALYPELEFNANIQVKLDGVRVIK
jgi:spore germination protein KC